MVKKILCILITCAVLFSFVACTTGDKTEEETTTKEVTTEKTTTKAKTTKAKTTKKETKAKTTEAETEPENPFEKKMEINWLCGTYTSHLYEEGRWDELELEEKFNIDLKLWTVLIHSGQMEQVEMMLAAGDVPDFGFYYKNGYDLYEQEMTRSVPEEFIRSYMPGLAEMYDENPLIWEFNKVEDKPGEYYGLNMVLNTYVRSDNVPLWNLDWLENLGYKMDDLVECDYPEEGFHAKFRGSLYYSSVKFTINDVTELFRAFTEDDPDGNGTDDTYAFPDSPGWYDRTIYGMFGIDLNSRVFYKDPVTGDVVPYYAHTYYKDYLAWQTDMMSKGYITTLPGEDRWPNELASALSTGKYGFFNMRISRMNTNFGNDVGTWPPFTILRDIDPEARFVITPPMGENGRLITYTYTPAASNRAFLFGGDVTDEKMIRILQMYEYSCFGDQWFRYRYGIEGVHYKWSGEPFNSALVFTKLEDIPKKYAGTVGMGQFGNTNFHIDPKISYNYEPTCTQFFDYFYDRFTFDELYLRPYKYRDRSTMPSEVYDQFDELYEETSDQIYTVKGDFEDRVWDGEIANIDTEWSQYIDQLYASGLEEWVQIWNSDEIKAYSELIE